MNGLGIDIVSHKKIKKYKRTWDKFLTKNEQKILDTKVGERKYSFVAGIWAAKEAIYKSSDNSIKSFKDIDISKNSNGVPIALIKNSNDIYLISISHEDNYSIAIAFRK